MEPYVRLKLPCGQRATLRSGDIIGRSDRTALCIPAPHISEAHAMVSLRSGELRLLALRGRFSVDGKVQGQVILSEGQRVVLASRTALVVEALRLPTEVLALAIDGGPPHLVGSVSSLILHPEPRLVGGFVADAPALFWTSGDRLFARVGEAESRALSAGDSFAVADHVVSASLASLDRASCAPTADSPEVGAALHLILNFDTVHIIVGPNILTLDGIPARIVSELAEINGPIAWQEIATQLWGDLPGEAPGLRERWDSSLARLRRKLRGARIRTNLVHSNRTGQVELILTPADTLENRM